MPDLARKSARRIQRAQERMQAAVLAAEVERSETFSGRSTEDTEVLGACPFMAASLCFIACLTKTGLHVPPCFTAVSITIWTVVRSALQGRLNGLFTCMLLNLLHSPFYVQFFLQGLCI